MLEDLTLPSRGWPCKVKAVAAELDAKDSAILIAAVDSADWPVSTLVRELRKRGVLLSDTPISKHRSRECSCYRA